MVGTHLLMMFNALDKTRLTYGMMLADISQAQAKTWRDGPDGWNILEIMCHIRDYQMVYRERIEDMLQEDKPTFKGYDRFDLIVKNDYAGQNVQAVMADYSRTRDTFIELLRSLDEAQWAREGMYPDGRESNVLAIALQLLSHDNDHIEQVLRVMQANR